MGKTLPLFDSLGEVVDSTTDHPPLPAMNDTYRAGVVDALKVRLSTWQAKG